MSFARQIRGVQSERESKQFPSCLSKQMGTSSVCHLHSLSRTEETKGKILQ